MLSIGTKKYRNLQEQVAYNTECIKKLDDYLDGITIEDKLVIIETDSGTFTDEELVILSGPLAFISNGDKVWMKVSETDAQIVFNAIDIQAEEVGNAYFNIGGTKITVNRADGSYNTADNAIITTYSKLQIDAIVNNIMTLKANQADLISGLALKANITGQDFTGAITAPSIIENMSGYSFSKPLNTDINIVYAGIVKTGNKLTMVIFGAYTPTNNVSADTATELGTFTLNANVVNKIYWYTSGSLTYVTAEGKAPLTYSAANSVDGQFYFRVGAQGEEVVRIYNKAQLTAGTTYHFRIEQTFLLSDNLAS